MNKKKVLITIWAISLTVFFAAAGYVLSITTCNCIDETAAKQKCATAEEYIMSRFKTNGVCDYNACKGTVVVDCMDLDAGISYTKSLNSFVIGCEDCIESQEPIGWVWVFPGIFVFIM